jgi:hypothetical protein
MLTIYSGIPPILSQALTFGLFILTPATTRSSARFSLDPLMPFTVVYPAALLYNTLIS